MAALNAGQLEVEISLKTPTAFGLRLWIAARIAKVAAWLASGRIVVSITTLKK